MRMLLTYVLDPLDCDKWMSLKVYRQLPVYRSNRKCIAIYEYHPIRIVIAITQHLFCQTIKFDIVPRIIFI
jgi:hypothetical protein